MKRLVLLVFAVLPLVVVAQNTGKKIVAILETVDKYDNVPYGIKFQVRSSLTYAISNTPGYEACDRVDISSIMGEHNFQRSGMVNSEQTKELGKMTGASYILIAEAANYSQTEIIIAAKILDVETASVIKAAKPKVSTTDSKSMEAACIQIARDLFKTGETYTNTVNKPQTSAPQRGQNFTETAFGLNMRMVYVEGGTFTMGCTSEQGDSCKSPTRRTTVGSFYIGMLEVTQSQWEKVMGTTVYQQSDKSNTGWPMLGTGADYPMYYVSWEEAKEFCARLSRQTGRTYRLPTEAEWEYAARGGNKNEGTKYSGGWTIGDVAWYKENSGHSTHPCGTKRANALGIYDMSGNVWEWCEDWFGPYLGYDTDNPRGASSGSSRVIRGGSLFNNAAYCRVSCRCNHHPDTRCDTGFRVVLLP